MAQEHWFDILNTSLVRAVHRRGFLRSASALSAGFMFGTTDMTGTAKNKRRKRRKKRPEPTRPQACSGGACQQEFVLPDNREYCERTCLQCDADDDPRQFCIVDADPTDPDNPMKVPVCCDEGETCCDAYCCPEGHACCDGHQCCRAGATCCDGACCGTDNPYTTCCDGRCMNTEYAQDHCGACGNACAAGEVCRLGQCECIDDCGEDECPNLLQLCSGRCVNTQTDPTNCGSCGNPCANGQWCEGGMCRGCGSGPGCCGGNFPVFCVDSNGVGNCRNTEQDANNCGACNNPCGQFEQCVSGQCV